MVDGRIHIYVYGRVQGVGFRLFVKETAKNLNLSGFVRNLFNGNVEVVAEGEKEKLNVFIDRLKEGQSPIRVDNIDVTFENPEGFKKFKIMPTQKWD